MASDNLVAELIGQAAAGNQSAFEQLYRQLVDRVFVFVVMRVRSRVVAEEVVQDSFVELYKALPQFRYQHDPAFYAFVFTIVRRQLAQQYNRTARTATEELPADEVLGTETNQETVTAVHDALATLDEASREVVVLHHWARYTFREIAAIMSETESAVRVRHHRAKARLATMLTR